MLLRSCCRVLALCAAAPLVTSFPLAPETGRRSNTHSSFKPLVLKDDGTFQISIFEDLHFGENAWDPWGPQQDIGTVKVLNKVLDREDTDLVVLNGDLITGENAFVQNSTAYIDQIVGPLVKRGLTWASTYGNHDSDLNISSAAIFEREKRYENSRTLSMVQGRNAGVSNYYLPVYAQNCSSCRCAPELLLWFFDSRGGFYYQEFQPDGSRVGQPGWVDTSVVDWFQRKSAKISAKFGRVIPSLAFVHIPPFVFQAIQTENGRASIDHHKQPGVDDDFPLATQAQGWCPDGRNGGSCDYGGQDLPFMKAIASTPGLIGLFSGHDHGNTWCYKWDRLVPGTEVAGNGVNLCFGQHSGYGGYGNWIRGGRQVRVSQDILNNSWEAETWIRLESGDAVGSVMLNATFGSDIYPATPNDQTYCPTYNYSVITPHPRKKLLADYTEPSHGQWLQNALQPPRRDIP